MNELRALRLAAGMTQEQVARHAGIAPANVAAYERGTRSMSPAMRDRVIRAMRRPSQALREHATEVEARLAAALLTNVRVFGSVARGQDSPGSDIDLLVDAAPEADAFTIGDALLDIEAALGFHVDIILARAVPAHKRDLLTEARPLAEVAA